jgi:type III secretion system PrgH/EprH family protein
MQASNPPSAVLRILNGPLQGAEFPLEHARTLFLVGPQAAWSDTAHSTVLEEAIYVPLEQGGCNFEVLLNDNQHDACTLRIASEQDSVEREARFQTRIQVGALALAIKPGDEAWADEVLSVQAPAIEEPTSQVGSPRVPRFLPAVGLVLAAVVAVGAWVALRENPVASIEHLLAGASGTLQVVPGRQGSMYIFAHSERDASWARQVLTRSGKPESTVIALHDERDRLQRVLAERFPSVAWHRFDFSDVANPRLWVSRQRNVFDTAVQQGLEQALLSEMPYARQVRIAFADDRLAARRAEEGLARLGIDYRRLDKRDSITLSVQGALQDNELLAVRDYVNEYYRLWGDRYVHFAVELEDDWLKGLSFQYGPSGYVKTTPSSWYFPKPL